MIFNIIMLGLSSVLFAASLVMFARTKTERSKYKEDIDSVKKVIDDNLKLSGQLFKLYSVLQDNQNLQIKAFEILTKNQKSTSSDLLELRDQVSNALVAIIEQMSGVSSADLLTKKDDDDDGKLMN